MHEFFFLFVCKLVSARSEGQENCTEVLSGIDLYQGRAEEKEGERSKQWKVENVH